MSFGIVNAIWRARQNAARHARDGASQGAGGRRGYDPNQPRVPAGHSDGGQWTSSGQGSAPSDDTIVNPDGSTVRSQTNDGTSSAPWDERHTVRMPSGEEFTFENFGPTQTIYDSDGRPIEQNVLTEDGPEPQAVVREARLRPKSGGQQDSVVGRGIDKVVAAAIALFTTLSTRNSPDRTAILAYRASDYRASEEPERKAVWVGQLTEEEVSRACKRYGKAQRLTNEAANETDRAGYETPAAYGTAVHSTLESKIKTIGNPNFTSEESVWKAIEEDPSANMKSAENEAPKRGARGSVRIDVLDNQGNGTVCVYDIKTGRRRLSVPRMTEIARSVNRHFPGTRRIIVAEMRPMK